MLEPVDLVYICGNKFLATNATQAAVHVTYRVVGSDETGSLTLREGKGEDQGFSETELETKSRGIVELYEDGERVARRSNDGRSCGASAISALVAGAASPGTGSWSAAFAWPNVAVHLSLLPDGRVLSWGVVQDSYIWDPATGASTLVPTPARLFCSGHAFLPDGRLLVSGGHITEDHGLPDNTIFDPATESWSTSTPMLRGRWYPTSTTLASGDVVILAGRDQAAERVLEPEVWTASGVRVLSTAPRAFPYYPRAFLAPNGKVFYAGEQRPSRYLDVSGTGDWESGFATVLYGNREYGAAVMYDEGKVLYVGGGRTTNTAEIIDLNSAAPAWQWTGSMAFPRRHLNATLLPTGEVLATSGTSGPGFNDIETAVHAAEVWSPITGAWTTLASNSVDRGYHSTAILLPDGRVLHAGSGDGGGQEGIKNAELFSPPYLLTGTRPTITDAPSRVGYGTSFRVLTPESDIAKVSLVRLGSTTHAFDMNQRFQWLSFAREAGALNITAPTSRNVTPPGHYMLFILNEAGVPSVARIVQVGSSGDPALPSDAAPTANFTVSCAGLGCQFTDSSTDDGEVTAWSWEFDENGGTSLERNPGYLYTAEGSYDVTLTVTDDNDATGAITKTITVTVTVSPSIKLTVSGRSDATKQYMTLEWSGANGATLDVFRNGTRITTTENDGRYTNSRTFQGSITYVYKVCEAGTTVCSNEATVVFGDGGTPNQPPVADFSSSCMGRDCGFTDSSTDADGSVSAWTWTFGDGTTSTARHPSHAYAAEGSYEVTLTAKDDDGATATATKTVVVTPPAPNSPPTAGFTASCTDLTCSFTDQSSDADGTVSAWSWTFGDGASATTRNPSHTYAAEGPYEVTLVAIDNDDATGTATQTVTVTPPPPNVPPTAGFTVSCTGLTCSFTDGSTDSDGTVTGWSWTFGDGASATTRNPSRTYTTNGTYTVALTATDNDGATGTHSKQLTVSGPTIVLTVTGRSDATTQYMVLTWSGASGAMVDVYRNGVLIKTTENDGKYTNSRGFTGAATYRYKVCQTGTTFCSNEATVVFS